jgi:hypothetical protein
VARSFSVMAAHGTGQRRCSPWRPRTPIYPFQIHTYSERTTELRPPCIYSMLKHELPRVGPRLRCVWNTNPLHMNSKADLVPLHSPVKCNDTQDITLSLAPCAQIYTCPVLPCAPKTRQSPLSTIFHGPRAPAAVWTVCERMQSL